MAHYIYVYGLVPAEEVACAPVSVFAGIEPQQVTYTIEAAGIVACVCRVDATDFSPGEIERKMHNPLWLEQKALHHHDTISLIHQSFTVIPMSFCTLFSQEEALTELLHVQAGKLHERFASLKGMQEWNIKVYHDSKTCESTIETSHPEVLRLRQEIDSMPVGKQFLMKKRLAQLISQAAEDEKEKSLQVIHQRLQEHSQKALMRQNWGKELTGRSDEMIANFDYLVPSHQVAVFIEEVDRQAESRGRGLTIEATGPWPPYHFATLHKEDL
ncbi:GvpL/GvpF family gas vesicle protein [Brevibacillus dissolubilis]|uniref:GvpL/GvpF family gas vesicle protein n=1 Tax=Brevibacillus dissolubilis TaxID=1844116 RepID=UPI00159BDAB9|nr:GvpL/GvpF family gas vesicle protein [Brevibacillus dissolubilis]